ncbi:hypothetical protein BGZ47_005189 [Haplosporangium gracile]|nr:hypothetical protein BGZ47_005189 [Haplosporangium gracile]
MLDWRHNGLTLIITNYIGLGLSRRRRYASSHLKLSNTVHNRATAVLKYADSPPFIPWNRRPQTLSSSPLTESISSASPERALIQVLWSQNSPKLLGNDHILGASRYKKIDRMKKYKV